MPLVSRIPQISAAIAGALDAGAYRTAEDQLSLEQQLTPVATGDLKGSERIEPARGAGRGSYRVVAGGTMGPKRKRVIGYAVPVERDQPYAKPAARALSASLRVRAELRRAIRGSGL